MRVPQYHRDRHVGFNMTPMIDVVFLLIIFFLVSSHLAKQEVQMELPLPEAATGEVLREEPIPRVTLNVLADGTLLHNGRQLSLDELPARLAERQAEGSALQVRIRGDRHVPYRVVEPILLACARAGVWDVSFAVFQRSETP